MRWDYPPLNINPVFPGLGIIIIIIVVIIITIISFFKVDFYILFPTRKSQLTSTSQENSKKKSDTKRFANSLI